LTDELDDFILKFLHTDDIERKKTGYFMIYKLNAKIYENPAFKKGHFFFVDVNEIQLRLQICET